MNYEMNSLKMKDITDKETDLINLAMLVYYNIGLSSMPNS